jgi:hypothetical protein
MHARRRLASLFLAALATQLPAGEPHARDADVPLVLDEIIVKGRRGLDELRQIMIALEDRFYERFNALNSTDHHDIHCAEEARTGALLQRRVCRVVYEARAHQVEGREHWVSMERSTRDPYPQPWVPPIPATVAIEAGRKAFREDMRDVTAAHPELLELLRQRAEVAGEYEALRRRSFGQKAVDE